MTEDSNVYETTSVRAVRGRESKTISKWEGEGWELVSRTPGKLQTELHFRRPKPKSRALIYGLAIGAVALVIAIIIGIGVATEGHGEAPTAAPGTSAPPSSASRAAGTGDATEPEVVADDDAQGDGQAVLTTENSMELRDVLELTDYCDSSIAAFAAKYEGRVIRFDASIDAMAAHDGASTRHDILLSAGDFSETESPGPAFQFRDVNTTSDLRYSGDVPGSIGVGSNIHVTAKIDEYEPKTCLLLIEPVETSFR